MAANLLPRVGPRPLMVPGLLLAATGLLLLSRLTPTYLASHRVLPPPVKAALTHGYTQAFLVGAGFLLVAAVVAALLINIGKSAASENDPVPLAG